MLAIVSRMHLPMLIGGKSCHLFIDSTVASKVVTICRCLACSEAYLASFNPTCEWKGARLKLGIVLTVPGKRDPSNTAMSVIDVLIY